MKILLPLVLLTTSVLLTTAVFAGDKECVVFVGTYTDSGSRGIYSFRFDANTGSLAPGGLAAASENPSYLLIDKTHRFLYAANEIEKFDGKTDGSVSVYGIDRGTGKLTPLQQVSSGGWGPVYLSMDRSARHLLVANYGAGTVAVLPIGDDGRLGQPTAIVAHKGAQAPRPHAIESVGDDAFVLVPDLTVNKLFVYRYDPRRGSLQEDEGRSVKLAAESGPRHLAIAPAGKFVYVANETASSVTVFTFDPRTGALHNEQTVSTLPAGSTIKNTAAEIALDATGRFLYVSNRGEDSVVLFKADPKSGRLTFVERYSSGGKTPRTFAIDPSGRWFLVANQGSDTITVFRRDPGTGRLSPTPKAVAIAAPAHLLFVPE